MRNWKEDVSSLMALNGRVSNLRDHLNNAVDSRGEKPCLRPLFED